MRLYFRNVVGLLLIVLFFFIAFSIQGQDEVVSALYKEGLRKYILEDYIGAIRDFESALKLRPDDSKIIKIYINTLIKQGNIEYEKGNLQKAKEYFFKAYALSGEDENLKENLKTIQERIAQKKEKSAEKSIVEKAVATEGSTPQRTKGQIEKVQVALPFDMDTFIQQQSEENRKILNTIIEKQREEREKLLQNIEQNQSLLYQNIEAQKEERDTLFRNIQESQKALEENLKAQKEDRNTLYTNIQNTQRLLEENIKSQKEERDTYLKNIMALMASQSEDRKLFSRSLMMLIGGAITITIIIFFGFFSYLRRRFIAPLASVSFQPPTSIEQKSKPLLEYSEKVGKIINEEEYLTDDRYSDIVRAKRLGELYSEFQRGNISWDALQEYISELNYELKASIIDIVEKKLKSGDRKGFDDAMEILLPFVTDGDQNIGERSRNIIMDMAYAEGERIEEGLYDVRKIASSIDPLSLGFLVPMAKMSDTKTGRPNHSLRVADIAFRIARAMNKTDLDLSLVQKVGLVHDIGYLELPDNILKKKGKLTEKQFAIIKTHPEKGLHLFEHIKLPEIFINGIKYHHERLDGSGYPEGLEGDDIPLIARLLAVADFFEAVTSVRPHRQALTVDSCLEMMGKIAGKIFDGEIYAVLVEIVQRENDKG